MYGYWTGFIQWGVGSRQSPAPEMPDSVQAGDSVMYTRSSSQSVRAWVKKACTELLFDVCRPWKGGDGMRKKAKQNYEYINEFASENYDRITIIVPKGSKERISAMAKAHGMNTSEFVVSMIPRTLVGKWKKKDADAE